MKKNKILIIIGIIVLLVAIGIIFFVNLSNSKNKNIPLEGTISGIDYKIIEKFNFGRYDYTKKGYYIDSLDTIDAPWYYIITMGEKPTSGYKLIIKDLKIDKNRNVEVIVKEIEPSKDALVSNETTYPACRLELSEYAKNIVIKNTKGEVYKKLSY